MELHQQLMTPTQRDGNFGIENQINMSCQGYPLKEPTQMHVSGGQIEAAFNSVMLVRSRPHIIYRAVIFIPQSGSMF